MLKTIGLLTCWYGPYPWYFPYFINSCGFNPTVDFILITDNMENIPNKPENVKVIYRSLDDIIELASKRLGFRVNIDYPYKLCDFKPAYGFIFKEVIENYDFWGQTDVDVIYGSIRDFMTPELLDNYDLISARHDYVTGSFALYKNCEKMNTLFKRSKDYEVVFSTSEHYCFDECNFAFEPLNNGISILELKTCIESFTEVVKKAELTGEIKVHFDFIILEGRPGRITFNYGRILYKNCFEGLMYHLILLKCVFHPEKLVIHVPDKYYISPNRIYHHR
jgi:hypothetical protein